MKFVALSLAVFLLFACGSRSSDESQVRALIANAENAAEARDTSDVLDVIAADYTDSQGFDRAQLRNFLRVYFLANPRIELLARVQDLQFPVDGLARARIDLTVLPAGDRVTLDVEFRRQENRWLVARADRLRE